MRRLVLLISSVLASAVVMTSTARATPAFAMSGSGTITGATTTLLRVADGNAFILNDVTGTSSGSITGTFTAEFTIIVHPTGLTDAVQGTFVCACSVGGQSGSITARFEGTGSVGPPPTIQVHAATTGGTGGLANLHWNLTLDVVGPSIVYSGTAHFDP